MRDLIVEELSVGAPPERVAQARKLIDSKGNVVQALIDLGFAPRDVLQACCAVTGVPPAPLGWLREPKPPASPVDPGVCRRLGCAPVALQNGKLCIVYLDPETAMRAEELPLPKHQPYLALPSDLQKAITMLPQPAGDEDEIATRINPMQKRQAVVVEPTRPEPVVGDEDEALFDDESRTQQVESLMSREKRLGTPVRATAPLSVPSRATSHGALGAAVSEDFSPPTDADAEPPDGATLVMSPVQIDAAELARGLPPRVADADADDDLASAEAIEEEDLFDERTTSVAALSPLPSAPKPAKRQMSGAVSETDAAAEVAKKKPEATATSAATAGKAIVDDPTASTRLPKRSPSLATPSHGTTKVADAAAGVIDALRQPTVRTTAPEHRSLRSEDDVELGALVDAMPAETVLTMGPPPIRSGAPRVPTSPRVATQPNAGPASFATSSSSAPPFAGASSAPFASAEALPDAEASAIRAAPEAAEALAPTARTSPEARAEAAPARAPDGSGKIPRQRPPSADASVAAPMRTPVGAEAADTALRMSVRAPTSAAVSADASRPSVPTKPGAPVATASEEGAFDTQQQARAVLSDGDLQDDSEEIDASESFDVPDQGAIEAPVSSAVPAVHAAPAVPAVKTPTPSKPSKPSPGAPAPKVVSGKTPVQKAPMHTPPPRSQLRTPPPAKASPLEEAQAAQPATQFTAEDSAAQSVDAVGRTEGEDDGQGAFASAGSADQEAVQNQKQRLKRIAQIASIKRYKIDRILGRGGMATVYYATDQKTGSACALKLMEPHLAEDAVFVERFKREIRASISLDHENIVRVFDYGEENGTYYMASEYVDGGTVASLLKSLERPLPVATVVPIMHGFLDGLQHAHEQGFVHRDLKPANLMFTKSGVIKIGDFGIAKAQTDTTLTKTGALFGTPAYMSPEQAQGQELDTRSDLFGVGIIFYELLSGYNPFAHENPSTTMFAIAKGQVRSIFEANPTVPLIVERVVHKLLERDKAKRYQSAGEARDDLKALLDLVNHVSAGSVARMLANPGPVIEELSRAQSVLESTRAAKLLSRSPPEHAEAAFRYYKSTLLDPQNYEAVNGLTQLRADYGFRFTRPDDKQLIELEQSLEKKAEQPALLRRLADLSATHRNLVDMAGFMKRYLRFMPTDTHVQHKLERIIGNDPLAPFSTMPAEIANRTELYIANDEMRDAARAASDEELAIDAPRGSGVRPAASVKSAASPGRPAPRGGPTPSGGSPPMKESSNPRRSGPADKRGPRNGSEPVAPTPTSVPEVEPVPRDSFEAMWFSIRGIIEDTARSLTGDQGFAAVKEMLKERFLGDGGDLKGAVKGALGKGKDVVADSLLKEEGRAQMKETAKGLWAQHGRLMVAVTVFFLVMAGLTRACAYACDDAPAVTAPKVGLRGHELDLGDEAKPTKPAANTATPADAKASAVAPPVEPEALTPEALEAKRLLEEKLLADKPKAVAVKADELATRQEDLKKRAKAEADIERAIALYTEAVDTDPYAAGARDALLDRARLHMANGNLDDAEADLFRLKRRPDVDAVKADVQSMLDDIAKAKKAAADPPPAP